MGPAPGPQKPPSRFLFPSEDGEAQQVIKSASIYAYHHNFSSRQQLFERPITLKFRKAITIKKTALTRFRQFVALDPGEVGKRSNSTPESVL